MTHAATEPTHAQRSGRTRRSAGALAGVVALGLVVVAACGGGDDDADEDATTTTAVAPAVTVTTAPPATTTTSTSTTVPPVEYVTEGATVVVANASGINGAAGRLSDRLAAVGFDMATATNSADSVSNLSTTEIYYDPEVAEAEAVAASLREALGGGDIEVLEVTIPAPTESGELGDADVLVLMGDDVADKSLDELQGRVAPTTTEPESTEESTEESGDESSTEESGDETTTTEASAGG